MKLNELSRHSLGNISGRPSIQGYTPTYFMLKREKLLQVRVPDMQCTSHQIRMVVHTARGLLLVQPRQPLNLVLVIRELV